MTYDDAGVEAALRDIEARVEFFGERCEGTYALVPDPRDEDAWTHEIERTKT